MPDALPRSSSRALVLVLCLLLIGGIGAADYLTGANVSLVAFYVVPIGLATWMVGRSAGLVLAAISAVAMSGADAVIRDQSIFAPLNLWNILVRLAFFIIVVVILDALHVSLRHEQAMARNDPLTGLANTRSFMEAADLELRRARRRPESLSVIYLDVDDLKAVNDSFGHADGSELIRRVGAVLRESLRSTDIVARIGGDEFCALLPETDEAAAREALARLRASLRAAASSAPWPLTASIGAATFNAPPAGVEELLHAADSAMYEVKQSGKDNVRHVLAEPGQYGVAALQHLSLPGRIGAS